MGLRAKHSTRVSMPLQYDYVELSCNTFRTDGSIKFQTYVDQHQFELAWDETWNKRFCESLKHCQFELT